MRTDWRAKPWRVGGRRDATGWCRDGDRQKRAQEIGHGRFEQARHKSRRVVLRPCRFSTKLW